MANNGLLERIRAELNHWQRQRWTFEDVGQHWDATEDYDDINEETYSYFRRFVDGYRFSELEPAGRVLDFCSRTGNGSTYFFQKCKVASAVCADVSFKMGEICRQRLDEAGLGKYLWVPVWQYSLPFTNESFDSILCFETVEHFPRPDLLISELGRVAKPGAQLILTTPNVLWEPIHALAAILKFHHSEGPHRFIRFKRLRQMVVRAGFVIEKQATTVLVPGGPDFFIRIGEWVEQRTMNSLMPLLGLRRIIIGRKL